MSNKKEQAAMHARMVTGRVIEKLGEGWDLKEALKHERLTMRTFEATLTKEPDLRKRYASNAPAPLEEQRRARAYIATIAKGEDDARALGMSGCKDVKQVLRLIATYQLERELEEAETFARVVHGKGKQMTPDEATMVLMRLHLYTRAIKPPGGHGDKYLLEAWPSLDDVLATAGVDRKRFEQAKAVDPATWANLQRVRSEARSTWEAEHRDYLEQLMVSALGEKLSLRTRTEGSQTTHVVPFLVVDGDGRSHIENRERKISKVEKKTLEPELAAIKYFHELQVTGGLGYRDNAQADAMAEEEVDALLQSAREDADDFLLLAIGGKATARVETGDGEDWMLPQPEDDGFDPGAGGYGMVGNL